MQCQKMFFPAVKSLVFFVICIAFALADVDVDSSSIILLSHSLGSTHTYESRGQINIRSLKTGSLTVQQDSSFEFNDFLKAAENDEFYHLEALVKYNGVERTFLSSTKACLLFESKLSDIITVHVDLMGNIYGVSVAASQTQCGGEVPIFDPVFNSTVLISYMEHGPVPDVGMYVQKLEQEKLAKERGEVKDNRSFIAKYWMYILPLVLVFMMSGAGNAEQQAAR